MSCPSSGERMLGKISAHKSSSFSKGLLYLQVDGHSGFPCVTGLCYPYPPSQLLSLELQKPVMSVLAAQPPLQPASDLLECYKFCSSLPPILPYCPLLSHRPKPILKGCCLPHPQPHSLTKLSMQREPLGVFVPGSMSCFPLSVKHDSRGLSQDQLSVLEILNSRGWRYLLVLQHPS